MMQLALDIELPANKTLDNFCFKGNEVLQNALQSSFSNHNERFFYLFGPKGIGKSHLLQALTQYSPRQAAYLPLKQLLEFGPDCLKGLETLDVICIDDLEVIAKDRAFEETLFHLYNQIRDSETQKLYLSARYSPGQINIQLPDLRSRLSWGLVFQLQSLDDVEITKVLQQTARELGLNLSNSCANYLLTHCSRNMHDLNHILKQLDVASLQAQRKLTIPFIKQVLQKA